MEFSNILELNLWKTLRINFCMFPFKEAIKFPVYVFGKLKIKHLSGNIKITCPIRRGIIRIGHNAEMNSTTTNSSLFDLEGNLVVDGQVVLGLDVVLIIRKGATFYMGEESCLRNRTTSIITKDVRFGKYVRLSHDGHMMTSNFHYLIDEKTKKVGRMEKPISIGDYCWIGNNCTIMPGTVIPPHTLVASHSLVNKDFSSLEKYSLIGGIPAQFIKSGISRIFNVEIEKEIHRFFNTHPEENEFDASHLYVF